MQEDYLTSLLAIPGYRVGAIEETGSNIVVVHLERLRKGLHMRSLRCRSERRLRLYYSRVTPPDALATPDYTPLPAIPRQLP